MKVVVWKSYGETDVYAADTPEQLARVVRQIIESVEGWGLDRTVKRVQAYLDANSHDYLGVRRAFNTMVDAVDPGSHEMFENIQIKEVK